LNNVRTSGQTARIPVFPLSYLVHNQPGEYFTYFGKIDKRGCKSGITQWIVFTKTCDVNREQVHNIAYMYNIPIWLYRYLPSLYKEIHIYIYIYSSSLYTYITSIGEISIS